MPSDTIIDGVDYGPLTALVGRWRGDKGLDVSPEPDGDEQNPYFETIVFEAIGEVTNAERQKLAALRYHQVVSRKSTGEVFHNESGYWSWDAAEGLVVQTLTIPRGVSLVAGGTAQQSGEGVELNVSAGDGNQDWGISQSPFMRDHARTTGFTHSISTANDTLTYSETTQLEIYGRSFAHTDANTLTRDDG